MAQLSTGNFSAAFDSFTEAIRLCPRRSVYHCNRAATALRLKRYDIAAVDSQNAAERDPSSVKALVRGGKAHMGLCQPELAGPLFAAAILLSPADKAASTGLEASRKLLATSQAIASREAAAASSGERAGLSLESPTDEAAAAQLLAAEAMLKANPRLQSAKVSFGEVCDEYEYRNPHLIKRIVRALRLQASSANMDACKFYNNCTRSEMHHQPKFK